MNKLKYEQAVAEGSKRSVVRPNDKSSMSKIKSMRDRFEEDKRSGGRGSAPTTAVTDKIEVPEEEAPREPPAAVSTISRSRSEDHHVTAKSTGIVTSPTKLQKTSIPMRQGTLQERDITYRHSNMVGNSKPFVPPKLLKRNTVCELSSKRSDETIADSKYVEGPSITDNDLPREPLTDVSTELDHADVIDAEELAPVPVSEPETNESASSSHDRDEEVAADAYRSDDEPSSKVDEFLENYPNVDTDCDSNGVGDEHRHVETGESTENITTAAEIENVVEERPPVLEFSDVCLNGESNDNEVGILDIESNSIILLENHQDAPTVVAELTKENLEQFELKASSLNVDPPAFDVNSSESTQSLRARFEALHNDRPADRPTPKANRISRHFENQVTVRCESCEKTVYPLEKIEMENRVYHKTCFRCSHCQCLLRMDSFTRNNNRLYCMPHFKQLFMTKGNYHEGFGDEKTV